MPVIMQSQLERYVDEIKKDLWKSLKGSHFIWFIRQRQDFRADSDVDIMILVDLTDMELKRLPASVVLK